MTNLCLSALNIQPIRAVYIYIYIYITYCEIHRNPSQ